MGFVSSLNFVPEGTYRTPPELRAELRQNGFEIGVHDFNHDGHLDLVVTNFGTFPTDRGGVSLLLGNGDGSFQAPANFAAGDFPVGIASGDFNGDGNPDVVVADFGTNVGVAAVTLLLGNGNNGF